MNLFEFSFGFSDGTIFFSFSTSHQVEKEIKTKFEKKICNKEKNSFLFFWWKLILIVVHWLTMHVTYLNICIVSTYHELGTSGCTASASSRWSTHFWYSALITFVLNVVLSCVVIYYVLSFVSLWYDVIRWDVFSSETRYENGGYQWQPSNRRKEREDNEKKRERKRND